MADWTPILSTTADNATVVRSFTVEVSPLNDQRTLDPLPSTLLIDRDAATQTLRLTGITAGGGESQPLRITVGTTNPSWIQNLGATYGGTGTEALLSFTVNGVVGDGLITVTVEDGGSGQ